MTQGKNSQIIRNADYTAFIKDVKQRIQSAQIKAAVRVNQELLGLYWDLGEQIIEKQCEASWGDGFLEQMSRDLQVEFPDLKGFSRRNLNDMKRWVSFWRQVVAKIAKQPVLQVGPQLVGQIPWGHNLLIINKISDFNEALFYVRKTIENNWSRAVLTHQIESGLYQRDGKAVTNFEATLPAPQTDLAIQMLKDPYNFDFLMLRERHDEKELEEALISEYLITQHLPNELRSSLPSIEEIEAEVDKEFLIGEKNYA
jgi:predicted nuclease of restriction endonuclease-like (RecB) superfamily